MMTLNRREYNPVIRIAMFARNSRSSESENWSSFVCGWCGLEVTLAMAAFPLPTSWTKSSELMSRLTSPGS